MKSSTLEARPQLTALFRKGARPAAVEVTTRRGVFQREVLYPKGDPNNPMTWDDVTKKFMTQAESVLDPRTAREVLEWARRIEKEPNVKAFSELLGKGL